MKIHVLGGHGGQAKGFSTTSILIDGTLLIDAGGVASTLSIDDQARIDHILISHCHLDHIKDLAFLSDNCFGMRNSPFAVYTHSTVKKHIKGHLLNDIIWPDFTALPNKENPTMTIDAIEPGRTVTFGGYKVTGFLVHHPHDAMGFIIEKDGKSVLFTGDTGPTEEIWKHAHEAKNLKAIFTEVSFPNRLHKVAMISDHHTASTLKEEMLKMPKGVPIILSHLKPNFRQEIMDEVKSLNDSRIQVLSEDGQIFNF